MTDGYIQLPTDGSGKKSRTTIDTISAVSVHTQVIKLTDEDNVILTPKRDDNLTIAFELDATGQPVYMGEALPGTAKNSAGWRIRKYTYSSGFVTDVQFADGTNSFSKTWDDRATYTYS